MKNKTILNILFSFVDQIFLLLSMYIINIYLVNIFSDLNFGYFVLIMTIHGFIYALFNSVVLEAYFIYGSGEYKNIPEHIYFIQSITFIFFAIISFICLAISLGLYFVSYDKFGKISICFYIYCAGYLYHMLIKKKLYVQNNFKDPALISVIFFICSMIMLIIDYNFKFLDISKLFLILGIVFLSVSSVFTYKNKIKNFRIAKIKKDVISIKHINYSKWILYTALIIQFVVNGYLWLAAFKLGPEKAGILKAFLNLVLPIQIISIGMCNILIPKYSDLVNAENFKEVKRLNNIMISIYIIIGIIFLICFGSFGEIILNYLYGKYTNLSNLFLILIVYYTLLNIGDNYACILKAFKKPQYIFTGYLWNVCFTGTLGILVFVNYGLIGVAIGMCVSVIPFMLNNIYYYNRKII